MSKFFDDIKELLIEESNEHDFNACDYYHVLLQNKNELKQVIDDYEMNNCYFYYKSDSTEGYTDGKIYIYFSDWQNHNYHYEIELLPDRRSLGYCQCTSKDDEYNPIYNCCGIECDWDAPSFNISKIEYIGGGSFSGLQKDLWTLREEWNNDIKGYKNKIKNDKVEYIEKQIEELQKRKEMILNED